MGDLTDRKKQTLKVPMLQYWMIIAFQYRLFKYFGIAYAIQTQKLRKLMKTLRIKPEQFPLKGRFRMIGNYLSQSTWVFANRHVLSTNT